MTDARYSREVLALALARESAHRLGRGLDGTGYLPQLAREDLRHLLTAFGVLDNAGVFSSLDTETDYTAAADVLAANAADRPLAGPGSLAHSQISHPSGQVPTERELKGCTHPADQPCFGQGFSQDQARALFGDTEADPAGKDDEADGRF